MFNKLLTITLILGFVWFVLAWLVVYGGNNYNKTEQRGLECVTECTYWQEY